MLERNFCNYFPGISNDVSLFVTFFCFIIQHRENFILFRKNFFFLKRDNVDIFITFTMELLMLDINNSMHSLYQIYFFPIFIMFHKTSKFTKYVFISVFLVQFYFMFLFILNEILYFEWMRNMIMSACCEEKLTRIKSWFWNQKFLIPKSWFNLS